MNLAQSLRESYASPLAALVAFPETNGYVDDGSLASCDERPPNRAAPTQSVEPPDAPWRTSGHLAHLPANQVVRWRIDGASNFGRRFYACPVSLLPDLPPRLIDVVIPDQAAWPPSLWDVLDASKSAHMLDRRITQLGISKHLVRALEYWSSHMFNFEAHYRGLPYGSAITVENIAADVADMRIRFRPKPHLVEKMFPWEKLQGLWDFLPDAFPVIALEDLRFKAQLQKSVILVQLPETAGGFIAVLKSRPENMKGLYHEIRNLLLTPACLNILAQLLYLVTTQSSITGGSRVCGCILRYYEPGALQEVLPKRRLAGTLSVQDSLRWARQLTSALVHITYSKPRQFFSDLKMDNILLSADGEHGTVLLIDHEQDRTIFACAPPEICYIDWLYELADTASLSPERQTRFTMILNDYLERKGVRTPFKERDLPYSNSPHGYYFPWLALSDEQREAAQVFLLGKALWCIFEGVGEPCNILGRSALYESGLEFPDFKRTPETLRNLIKRCTTGAREWSTGPLQVYRRESKIYPRGKTGVDGQPIATVAETMDVIKQTWMAEVEKIAGFVAAMQRYDSGDHLRLEDCEYLGFLERPKLQEVLDELENFQI